MPRPRITEFRIWESNRIPAELIDHPPNVGESQFSDVVCPSCGHAVSIEVDASAGDQVFIDDCPRCGHAIEISVHAHDLSLDDVAAGHIQ